MAKIRPSAPPREGEGDGYTVLATSGVSPSLACMWRIAAVAFHDGSTLPTCCRTKTPPSSFPILPKLKDVLQDQDVASRGCWVGLPNVGKSTLFNIVTKVGSRTGNSRLAVKKSKAEKDPNKPMHPPSAFFIFMGNFRKEYKEKHPDIKKVSVIGKADGEKWKSLSDAVPWKMPSHVEATTLFQGLPLHLPVQISRLSP